MGKSQDTKDSLFDKMVQTADDILELENLDVIDIATLKTTVDRIQAFIDKTSESFRMSS